jgi:glycine/D-amino acid oxidase-like deaminating enzyme
VLKTARGDVVCDTVILAGNALLRGIAPELESRRMPVRTYIAATPPPYTFELGFLYLRSWTPPIAV